MDKRLKLLLVEDSVADAEIDALTLESGGLKVDAKRVETELDYLMALRDEPDLILSDHSMPSFDALRALKILREQGRDTPFIVVSGRIGEAAAVDLMKAGANDYVRKDELARLAPAVRRELTEAENRRRARTTADKLRVQERTLDTLMNNLPGMVYRLRADGDAWRLDFVSAGSQALTGYDTAALTGGGGFDFNRLLYDDAEPSRQRELWEQLESAGHFTLEHQILCASGDVKWVWHRGAAVRDHFGRTLYVEGFMADVTSHKVDQEKLDYLAHHDVLTGLSNRAVFEEQLSRSLGRVKRHFQNVTLLFIDLDNFKEINDSWGHQSGDAVLRTIADRLTESSRKGDIVARLGGDEFAIVMDDNEKTEDVADVVPRILEEIAQPFKWQGREHTVTASIGIAVYPVDGEDVTTLVRNADAAMYAAKEGGRNTFRFFAKKMNDRAKSMVVMRNALHKALRQEELELQFQPEVWLSDRRIAAVESLVRWKRSRGRLMTAEHFIPFAEDAGVVAAIDHWVMRQVCRQASAWSEAGVPFERLAFNLSAQALSDPKVAKFLEAGMVEFGVDPEWLEIEITETTIMRDMISTRITLEKIADMGVRLTLDDFGKGYSSLNYLRLFPIRRLKIDRDFIKELPWKGEDVQICRAILAMADSLHIEVVAEGIEKPEQATFLHHAGCEAGQGYLFALPLSAAECEQLLREGHCAIDPSRAPLTAADDERKRLHL
ncbi:MAG TPA: EAL domain-containing protein [Gammaproteobacteria bacterium]|nr:EAL domain-containing protein [Gammaproteobacteria bacterium]